MRDVTFPTCVRILNATLTVTQPPILTAVVSSFTNASCNNSSTGAIDLTVTGGTSPYSYLWSSGSVTEDITNLGPGVYTVTVTDGNGCRTSITQEIVPAVQLSAPDVVAVWTNPSCTGTNGGTITVSAVIVGRVPIPTYEYSLDATTWQRSNFFGSLVPGNYTAYARVVGENCIGSFNLTITSGGGPTNISVSNITQTSAVVTWTPPAGASTYNIRYRILNSINWTTVSNISTSSFTLTGLQSGTTYQVAVQTNCESGLTSAWSNSLQFTTQVGTSACPVPGGLFVTRVNSTTVRVDWTPVSGTTCYIISWGVASSNPNSWPAQTVSHPTNTFQITGLTQNLNYQVRIRANCTACSPFSGVRSDWGALVNFTTGASGREEVTEWLSQSTQPVTEFKVYPNPNQGNFTVSFDVLEAGDATVTLHDLSGRQVHTETFNVSKGLNELPIQLQDVSSGLYILRMKTAGTETSPTKILVN